MRFAAMIFSGVDSEWQVRMHAVGQELRPEKRPLPPPHSANIDERAQATLRSSEAHAALLESKSTVSGSTARAALSHHMQR